MKHIVFNEWESTGRITIGQNTTGQNYLGNEHVVEITGQKSKKE